MMEVRELYFKCYKCGWIAKVVITGLKSNKGSDCVFVAPDCLKCDGGEMSHAPEPMEEK